MKVTLLTVCVVAIKEKSKIDDCKRNTSLLTTSKSFF